MKRFGSVACGALLLMSAGVFSCTPTDAQIKATPAAAPLPPPAKAPVEVKTPRFDVLDDALEYLGAALGAALADGGATDGFSAQAEGPGNSDAPEAATTPEERTRANAADALAELDREIARKEGRAAAAGSDTTRVVAAEGYTRASAANRAPGGAAANRPKVIAVADFVNSAGNVSQLGRYVVDKLTPHLARTQGFAVVERAIIDQVLAEQRFQVSAFVDEASTQEFGKLVGAAIIISGSIVELDDAFYFNAKAVGIRRGDLLAAIDVEVARSGRLAALYRADLPKPVEKKHFQPQIFRAEGLGVPPDKQKNPAVARALAARAAKVDALRNLAQQIEGARIDAETTVKDYTTENDRIQVQVNSYVRGARVIRQEALADGTVQVEMEVEVPAAFFEQLYGRP